MSEQALEIIENGQYKNIALKGNMKKGIDGLEDGNHVVIEKVFASGYENNGQFGKSFSCKAIYNGDEVSFWLNEKEHEVYQDVGGEGDKVKITGKDKTIKTKMGRKIITELTFELME